MRLHRHLPHPPRLHTLTPAPAKLLLAPLLAAVAVLLLVLGLLSLSSCQTTGSAGSRSALQTFDSLYTQAVAANTLAITGTTDALKAGLISGSEAEHVLNVTDSIQAILNAANSAAQAGDAGTASADLAAATASITVLSACLTLKPLTIATFAACIAKLQPPVHA